MSKYDDYVDEWADSICSDLLPNFGHRAVKQVIGDCYKLHVSLDGGEYLCLNITVEPTDTEYPLCVTLDPTQTLLDSLAKQSDGLQ